MCSACSAARPRSPSRGWRRSLAWARGDQAAVDRLRECEHRADERKRELRAALTVAFTTPLEPEDLFELSRGLDRVLNNAKNAVREAEVMEAAPDAAIAEMAAELADGTRTLAGCDRGARPRRHRSDDRGRRPRRQEPEPGREGLPAGDVRADRGRRSARGRGKARSSTAGSPARATTSATSPSASGTPSSSSGESTVC